MRPATGVGVVGVGFISAEYVQTLQAAPDVEVCFLAARNTDRARARAAELGVPGFGAHDELLRDPAVEVVVNLTVPQVHAELTKQALESGRHVYSEKPLARRRRGPSAGGPRGVSWSAAGCAPDTFLGTGLQTALRTLRCGRIGTPRSAFANFQCGGPNLWHPNPKFLFQAGGGPLLGIGPYHLTALVQVFGAVAGSVRCKISARPGPDRHLSGAGGGPPTGLGQCSSGQHPRLSTPSDRRSHDGALASVLSRPAPGRRRAEGGEKVGALAGFVRLSKRGCPLDRRGPQQGQDSARPRAVVVDCEDRADAERCRPHRPAGGATVPRRTTTLAGRPANTPRSRPPSTTARCVADAGGRSGDLECAGAGSSGRVCDLGRHAVQGSTR